MKMRSARLFVIQIIMNFIPPTRCFALKRTFLRWAGAQIGNNCRIVSSARFYLSGRLIIGDDTWIGHEVLVVGGDADVIIGSKVDIAPRVSLMTGTHELYGIKGRAAGEGYSLPITIEDGAWLCASSTILGGVTVGSCGVVAAGALVNRSVSPGSVFGGVPAHEVSVSCKGAN
jgi:Acetyltransferase (isoleucine patch superfamily)